jgi:hypothetical protein
MDEKTRTAAGIAGDLQGLHYEEKRLAEIAAELAALNESVRLAARQILVFDDEPAAFASLLRRAVK